MSIAISFKNKEVACLLMSLGMASKSGNDEGEIARELFDKVLKEAFESPSQEQIMEYFNEALDQY